MLSNLRIQRHSVGFTALLGTLVGHFVQAEPLAHVELANPSESVRIDEAVHLRLIDLGLGQGEEMAENIVAYQEGIPVPVQAWDRDGDGEVDTVTLLADFDPAERKRISLELDAVVAGANAFPQRTYAEISQKVGGDWNDRVYEGGAFRNVQKLVTPEDHTDHSYFIRYEGPGWESEKVGYRLYLDWRNGFDIFGKLNDQLALKEVGQDGFDSYHEESDWGMDILKVGNAVGCGGFGLWVDDRLERISDTDGLSCSILENGPVLSQFEVTYRNWKGTGLSPMDLVADLSIQAGSRLTWVNLRPTGDAGELGAGIVKADGVDVFHGDTDVTGEAYTYLGTWGPQSLDGSDVGMAILVRKKDLRRFAEDDLNNVVVFRPSALGVEYAFLAAWSREPGGIQSKEAFVEYLEETAHRLTIPTRVDVYSALDDSQKTGEMDAVSALYWTKRMADSILERRGNTLEYGQIDPESRSTARWSYTTGLISKAVYDLAQPTGVGKYAEWGRNVISSYISEAGDIHTYKQSDYNIDHINSGKMVLQLYEETGEERYRIAAQILRDQLKEHPTTKNGAFWHKKRYPWQVWLDGVYMGIPFLVGYDLKFAEGEGIEAAVHEFLVCEKQMRDPETGLYYHAWDEAKEQVWADKKTGRSGYFWGRGLGWYAMALVDVLEYLPEDSAESKELQRILQDLAEALVAVQDSEKKVWYQILDRPNAPGNYPESSASSMFVYTLAKAVNHGWLDESFREPAKLGFEGIVKEFVRTHADGTCSLTHICRVAGLGYGRDGSYEYYMSEPVVENDPKGIGPFLLAGYQVSQMLK